MYRMKKLKAALALFLALAMTLEPVQSVGYVRAEEAAAEENAEALDAEALDAEISDAEAGNAGGADSQTEEAQGAEETRSQETGASAPGTEAVTETEGAALPEEAQTDTDIGQETLEEAAEGTAEATAEAEETTQEETDEERLTDEAEELKLSETEIKNASALSIGRNEGIVIKKDEESRWYYFEPEEDGAYIVRLGDDYVCYECGLKINGAAKTKTFSCYNSEREKMLLIKAGERVYFQPYFAPWETVDDGGLTTTAAIEVEASEKGTVERDSDGKYTLSYHNAKLSLDVSASNTTIRYKAKKQDNKDETSYWIYAYCSGVAYGGDACAYINSYGYNYGSGFYDLDINEPYHIYYVLRSSDGAFAWFDGTGEPFDVTTKNTDKVGGEITGITTDCASITVSYEFFSVDVVGRQNYAWIRYRKDGEGEWEYLDNIWVSEDECVGSAQIDWTESGAQYTVELVSWDKKTVYDSRQVTTENYDEKITVTVNESGTKTQSVQIDITGYDVNISDEDIRQCIIQLEYTDSFGTGNICHAGVDITSDEFQSGTLHFKVGNDLEAGTEYKDAKIRVGWQRQDPDVPWRFQQQWIYSGKFSFTTKESLIKAENISADITPIGLSTAEIAAEVKEIPSNESFYLRCDYRRKGTTYWNYSDSIYLTSDANSGTFRLRNLYEADYEIRLKIDGVTKIQEYHFTPAAFEGDVKTTVKVTKKFVNGLEVEASLAGAAADSEDTYRCIFEVANKKYSDGWARVGEINLNPAEPVTYQLTGWCIYSGAKQQWRYIVYKNNEEYEIGYLDAAETQTIPLELELSSIEAYSSGTISFAGRLKNWSDVLTGDDYYDVEVNALIREKGREKWEEFNSYAYITFDKYGNIERADLWFYYDNEEQVTFDSSTQYELRLVSIGDESVVYAETTFTAAAEISEWSISEENNFVYNSNNTRCSIGISGNYEKPAVEVENTNIVSVKEIRQSKIYLEIHSVGTTKLTVTADGITKTVSVTVSPFAQEMFYLDGADESLQGLKLPDKFKWVNPSETPKADDENKVQYFDVTIEKADGTIYGKAPVAVGTLDEDGITIQGRDTIGSGKEGIYSVYYAGRGFDVAYYGEGKAYEISQEWTGDDGLVIKEGGAERNVTVTGAAAGEHELTLTVKVKNLQTGKTLERKKTQKIRVIGAGLIDNLVIKPAKEQPADAVPCIVTGSVVSGQVIEINCEGYDFSKTNKLQLEAKTDKGTKNEVGEPILDDASVNWSSGNEDIFAIDEKGLVTIKNKGEGRLNAAAQDGGQYTEQALLKIYDNSPLFACTEITVKAGSSEGTKLSYEEKDGNRITGMALTGSDKLEAVQHAAPGADWYVRAKAEYAEETTEHITLEITTENKKTYIQPLTVTVLPAPKVTLEADAGAGTVAFSQTAIPNLFYVNSEAVFDVADSYENYEIEDIRTIEKDKDAQNFHVKQYNAAQKTITFTANKLDANSVAAYAAKNSSNAVANVEVKFKGYDGYYPKDGNGISIKVAVQNKPISALKAEDAVVTGSASTALVDALDKKTVFDLSGSSFEIVAAKTKAENLTAEVENGSLKLTQTGANAKGGKYTLNVTNPNWTKTLTLTGKITKVDVPKLTMKLSKTKATLNAVYNDKVTIRVSIKGNESLPFMIDTEVKPATDALAVRASEDNKGITLEIAQGKTLACGKYTISVAGKIGEEKTKAAKLTLTVTDKEPEVKLSAKGSVNILNRDLSGVTYTAAIKNTDAEIQSAVITGEGANTFRLVDNDGKKFMVKTLKDAEAIDTKQPYEIKLKLTLSNGAVIENAKGVTLKVKPVSKLPKIKVNAPKNPSISKSVKNGVMVKLDMEAGYQIARIEPDGKDKDKFDIKMNGQGVFTIRLNENASSIEPKNYSLKYKIYFIGANAATKQATKSIKITVSE